MILRWLLVAVCSLYFYKVLSLICTCLQTRLSNYLVRSFCAARLDTNAMYVPTCWCSYIIYFRRKRRRCDLAIDFFKSEPLSKCILFIYLNWKQIILNNLHEINFFIWTQSAKWKRCRLRRKADIHVCSYVE